MYVNDTIICTWQHRGFVRDDDMHWALSDSLKTLC